jgi:hypothetical protein
MVNKKVIYGVGAVVVLGVAYYAMKKKKGLVNASSGVPAVVAKNNYPVSLSGDTQEMRVWVVIDGKKYAVGGTQALIDYGLDPAKYPYTVLTQAELDAIPTDGQINPKGVIQKY